MGNFSNDPQARLIESTGKQYVGVRMQQAVPILDADWNLLEDLRRREFETMGRWFIGDGVPAGSDAFRILPGANPNDFGIRQGLFIAVGKLTEAVANTTYATQPNFGSPDVTPPVTALTTPVANKSFIAYLDVWEREVDSQKDPALVDAHIGVETAIRLKRDWVVRVARVPEDVPGLSTPPVGHVFVQLAKIDRTAGNANITVDMIHDLRETQLTINRKIEVRDGVGTIVVDNTRFGAMLKNTRDSVLAFSNYLTTVYNSPSVSLMAGEILGLQAIEVISHAADAGLAMVNAHNLASNGALQYMSQLYDGQNNFFNVWHSVVLQLGSPTKKYAGYQVFVNQLDALLHQPLIGPFTGLLKALQMGDLTAAVTTQEQIASLFSTAGNANVPHGSIQVILANSPAGVLSLGQVARFEFKIKSATTVAGVYTASILPQAGWPRIVVDSAGNPIPNNKIPIGPSPSVVSVFVDVTVQAGSSGLQLRLTSDTNPAEIDQTSNVFTLTQGQPAPLGEDKIQFRVSNVSNGSIDPSSGAISITRTQKSTITVQVTNNTGQSATFALALAKNAETPAGTWTATYKGDASIPIPNGGFVSEQMDITPSGTATSVQLQFTASATISGSPVTAQLIIPCAGA
jgi:hypothetical protein